MIVTMNSPSVILESLTIEKARRIARRMRTWRGYLATLEAVLAKEGVSS